MIEFTPSGQVYPSRYFQLTFVMQRHKYLSVYEKK